MSDKMKPIPFASLMEWILHEHEQHTTFGVHRKFFAKRLGTKIFGRHLELPFGPAAGPHTQLAQNLIAGYTAGARFFELKTVQKLAGDDLQISKPCIRADDECYNVEWSTELTVEEAFAEYAKAWVALHVLAIEYGYGAADGFQFNMSVGYDLAGIKSPPIDKFIENLKNAAQTEIFQACIQWLEQNITRFRNLKLEAVKKIPATICNSITVSTMHGCPPDEIERIGTYLLQEKQLNTFIKCNPTLLGYDFVRQTLDSLGYGYMVFDDHHFKADLQYQDAIPMLKRLQAKSRENKLLFGVKLTNTFPVEIKKQELPGEAMYMSGKPLFFLSLATAKLLSEAFEGHLAMSYSGGADYFNIKEILAAGIWPITLATTLLKPGGYERLAQIAETLAGQTVPAIATTDTAAIDRLWSTEKQNSYYKKLPKIRQIKKIDQPVPLTNCFKAPCQAGCPIDQDIPAYMRLTAAGNDEAALRVILQKNPLPSITGNVCYHTCMNRCNRNFYEAPVEIRTNKLRAAQGGYAAVMAKLPACAAPSGKKAAIIGGGPAGLAAAYFLVRGGIDATVIEKNAKMGGAVRYLFPKQRISEAAIDNDLALIEKMGVHFSNNRTIDSLAELAKSYDFIILAIGAAAAGLGRFRQPDGSWLGAPRSSFYKKIGLQLDEKGKPVLCPASLLSSLPHTYVIGDGRKGLGSVVKSISDAQRVTAAILQTCAPVGDKLGDKIPKKLDAIYQQRGELATAPSNAIDTRCLDCDIICQNCVEVCPNRANITIKVAGMPQLQILHLDSLCNECGNCRSFCPWNSAPYQDKFTFFNSLDDMHGSKNQGFALVDRAAKKFQVRLGTEESAYIVGSAVPSIDPAIGKIIDTVFADYQYLFEL